MNLSDLLEPGLIKVPVESMTRDEVIAELVEQLVRQDKIGDRAGILDTLYERERKGSTGIGCGVAVPHARHPDVDDCLLAVGIAPEGIEFDAVDDEPVYLVFLLLGAPDKPSQTIEALADIGLLVQIPNVYDRLISARDPENVIQIINEAHEEQ